MCLLGFERVNILQKERLAGHNVLHLIYPIKTTEKSISDCLKSDCWEVLYKNDEDESRIHHDNFHYIFPTTHHKEHINSGKRWLSDRQIIAYFHPSVQEALFHKQLGKLQAYRYKMQPKAFIGEMDDEVIEFEWLSAEIYSFGFESGVLVLRVSMLENVEVVKEQNEFKTIRHLQPIQSLNTYMKFTNRIRQNYKKFAGQPSLKVVAQKIEEEYINIQSSIFFNVFEKREILPKNVVISSVKINHTPKDERLKTIEPNTFVHSLIQCDLNGNPLTTNELYQIIHIDDIDGESGGNTSFKEQFIKNNVYKRWENYNTYYTGIEYGAVTFVDTTKYEVPYYEALSSFDDFPNLLYQHHCRMYLIMMILQYYYREELQEIIGRYARLELTEDCKLDEANARKILNDYYNLNQFVFFKRISQEKQGMEMWNFYLETIGINTLYEDASKDVAELHQRLIEQHANEQEEHQRKQKIAQQNQEEDIRKLTIIAAFTGLFGMNLIIPFFEFIKLTDDQKAQLKNFIQFFGIQINNSAMNIIGNVIEIVSLVCGIVFNGVVLLIIIYIFINFKPFSTLLPKRHKKD